MRRAEQRPLADLTRSIDALIAEYCSRQAAGGEDWINRMPDKIMTRNKPLICAHDCTMLTAVAARFHRDASTLSQGISVWKDAPEFRQHPGSTYSCNMLKADPFAFHQ